MPEEIERRYAVAEQKQVLKEQVEEEKKSLGLIGAGFQPDSDGTAPDGTPFGN